MQYLLDTHCLIWFQENNSQIPQTVMKEIQNPDNAILFSQISLFEIAIKQKIGKLLSFSASTNDIYEQAIKDDFSFLPIQNKHIEAYQNIPLLPDHRDPFDRLLIATASTDNLIIITADKNFSLYSSFVTVFWK